MHLTDRLQRRRMLAAGLLGISLAACGWSAAPGQPGATPTSAPQATPAGTAQPAATILPLPTGAPAPTSPPSQPTPIPATAAPAAQPIIGFEPKSGAPGTAVTVFGSGYTPGAPVVVRLGLPNPTGEVLASASADSDGRWSASLVIPDRLPSGDPISTDTLYLVAMDANNVALASAPFGFSAPPSVERAEAPRVVERLLRAWQSGGNLQPYLAMHLLDELRAGRPADQVLGFHPVALESFQVDQPEDRPAEVLFVPATLNYRGFSERRVFELVVSDGQWVVWGIGQPVTPAQGGGSPATEWQVAQVGDLSADNIEDTVYYRASAVTARASFNDPVLDARAVVAAEVKIVQDGAHGPWAMLLADAGGVRSPGFELATYAAPGPAAYLLALDPGSGIEVSLIPLNADGSPYAETLGMNWRASEYGFRLSPPRS